jgi:hypothetical protein
MANKIVADMKNEEQPDVNEAAAQFISDWITANDRCFSETSPLQRYGFINEGTAYVLPTILREALEKGGFSYRKTMNWLAERGIAQNDKSGKNTIIRRFGGTVCRMVALDLEFLHNPPDPDGFVQLDATDGDLPF